MLIKLRIVHVLIVALGLLYPAMAISASFSPLGEAYSLITSRNYYQALAKLKNLDQKLPAVQYAVALASHKLERVETAYDYYQKVIDNQDSSHSLVILAKLAQITLYPHNEDTLDNLDLITSELSPQDYADDTISQALLSTEAYLSFKRGDITNSLEMMVEAFKNNNNDVLIVYNTAVIYDHMANYYRKNQQLRLSASYLKRAIKLYGEVLNEAEARDKLPNGYLNQVKQRLFEVKEG
jgi:tetratricopeptide (TPR) repeat protein